MTSAPDTELSPDPRFERPVFIVNPPRSGSSLLFETLSLAPGLFTVGGESHGLIEDIAGLHPKRRGWQSNRLDETDAGPEVVDLLRRRMDAALRDRHGQPAPPQGRIRLLEKTPKNALRIPFLGRTFPEARFVLLLREPLQVMASMIEGWESGRMRTYPALPGWTGPGWSMLLTPGWRDLIGRPVAEIVARQWAATIRLLLDDVEALAPQRWTMTRYDQVIAAPQAEMRRLAAWIGVDWDRPLPERLKFAAHTLSRPHPDKWRRRETELQDLAPIWADQARRVRLLAGAPQAAADAPLSPAPGSA